MSKSRNRLARRLTIPVAPLQHRRTGPLPRVAGTAPPIRPGSLRPPRRRRSITEKPYVYHSCSTALFMGCERFIRPSAARAAPRPARRSRRAADGAGGSEIQPDRTGRAASRESSVTVPSRPGRPRSAPARRWPRQGRGRAPAPGAAPPRPRRFAPAGAAPGQA